MASPTPDPQSPAPKAREEPSWEVVVFQVEDRIFHGLRHTFTRASDVFEGMFLLPQGDSGEGSSKDRPIILHGCKEDDFAALMKVLHPMSEDVTLGFYNLSKAEWIGVLRLATMWEMAQVRSLCVDNLFNEENEDITGVDMVVLAREFRVRSWFLEGISRLVLEMPDKPLQTLVESLGVSTACKIADLYPRCTALGALELVDDAGTPYVRFSLNRARCAQCFGEVITTGLVCLNSQCVFHNVQHESGKVSTSPGLGFAQNVIRLQDHESELGFVLQANTVLCAGGSCTQYVFRHGRASCTFQCSGAPGIFLGPTDEFTTSMIEDVFEEELKGFDL